MQATIERGAPQTYLMIYCVAMANVDNNYFDNYFCQTVKLSLLFQLTATRLWTQSTPTNIHQYY